MKVIVAALCLDIQRQFLANWAREPPRLPPPRWCPPPLGLVRGPSIEGRDGLLPGDMEDGREGLSPPLNVGRDGRELPEPIEGREGRFDGLSPIPVEGLLNDGRDGRFSLIDGLFDGRLPSMWEGLLPLNDGRLDGLFVLKSGRLWLPPIEGLLPLYDGRLIFGLLCDGLDTNEPDGLPLLPNPCEPPGRWLGLLTMEGRFLSKCGCFHPWL